LNLPGIGTLVTQKSEPTAEKPLEEDSQQKIEEAAEDFLALKPLSMKIRFLQEKRKKK
jgi:hypothetical protein